MLQARFRLRSAILPLALIALMLSPATLPAGNTFIRGDGDGDGQINIVDPIVILNYIAGLGVVSCLDAVDANDDSTVNVVDAIYMLYFIFVPGSAPPPSPFPGCGADPNVDPLDCQSFPLC